jgi:hypothetical protein
MPDGSIIPQDALEKISDAVVGDLKQSLGMEMNDAMLETVQQAAASNAEQQVNARVSRAAQQRVSELVTTPDNVNSRIQSGMTIGKAAMGALAVSQDYLDMLASNARMVKAKFDAYVSAGFTDGQAFRLIEAEVAAKGTPGQRR